MIMDMIKNYLPSIYLILKYLLCIVLVIDKDW